MTAGELLEACGVLAPEIISGIAWLTFKRLPESLRRVVSQSCGDVDDVTQGKADARS